MNVALDLASVDAGWLVSIRIQPVPEFNLVTSIFCWRDACIAPLSKEVWIELTEDGPILYYFALQWVVGDYLGGCLCSPVGNHLIPGIDRRPVFVSLVGWHSCDRMLLSILSVIFFSISSFPDWDMIQAIDWSYLLTSNTISLMTSQSTSNVSFGNSFRLRVVIVLTVFSIH